MKKLILALTLIASAIGAVLLWRNLPKIQAAIEERLLDLEPDEDPDYVIGMSGFPE